MSGETQAQVVAVIVSYRSAVLSVQAVEALARSRAQSGLPQRAVVVDNDSGDAEPIRDALAAKGWLDWVEVLPAPRNGGFGYGNNVGMARALAQGPVDYFWLVNPDTVVEPEAVLPLVQVLEKQARAGIVGSGFDNADGSDWPIAFRFPSSASEFEQGLSWRPVSRLLRRHVVARVMPRALAQVDWVAGASMMVRASMICELGGFDEQFFLYYEETELSLRAAELGWQTWYQPASRVMHIAGCSTQLTRRDARPPRMPSYWFESRSRYFRLQRGNWGALRADMAGLLGQALGNLKLWVLRRPSGRPPCLWRDLWSHAIWWRWRQPLAPRRPGEGLHPPSVGAE